MTANPYTRAQFLKSAAALSHLPPDEGYEVAFAGRSNAGKSTALNCLTNQKIARTSKTPGRTQLINLFALDEARRLVDLPGYGYAKVSKEIKENWQKTLEAYLLNRQCLRGIVLLMDCRHPLKEHDAFLIDWALSRGLRVHILLTKGDKLSKSALKQTLLQVQKQYDLVSDILSVQSFSALKKEGISELIEKLNEWYEWDK